MSHVDTAQDINTVEWFFGYGGNHIGLKRVLPNLRLLAACEIEEFAVENILAKMEAGLLEAAPIWSDCKTFPWEPFADRTHLFVASYPCTPFSAAGKRQGAEDERHLWPYVYRWILRARPLLVLLENVEGHISLGLSTVISDLEEGGYKATWGIFSASEVGAPHQRKRVFILAYRNGVRLQQYAAQSDRRHWQDLQEQSQGSGASELADSLRQRGASGLSKSLTGHEGFTGIADDCGGEGCGELANSERFRSKPGRSNTGSAQKPKFEHYGFTAWPSRPGEQQFAWEPPRVVANAQDPNRWTGDSEAQAGAGPDSEWRRRLGESDIGAMGQPKDGHPSGHPLQLRQGQAQHRGASGSVDEGRRQAQPSLGRDADGLTHRLDDAVLHVSTDNRTDELRLLGNGVVPATAERAFRVLVGELMEEAP